MITGDGGNDTEDRLDRVGRIIPAAQADLENRDVDVIVGKKLQGEGRGEFEKRQRQRIGLQPHLGDQLGNALFRNHGAIDPDPLIERVQVW